MTASGDAGAGADDAPETGSLFEAPAPTEQERMVEAILFAADAPVSIADLAARMPHGCDPATALARLEPHYAGRGVRLVRVGAAWAFRTAPDLGFLMTREQAETRKLSRAAIETLAIIAYHQPVTRAEIEEIRGVGVSRGTLDQLMEMDWVRLGRRRMTPGRPVTFVVTEAFLDHFSLASARDLPGLKELRAAGLLDNRPAPEARLGDGEGEEEDDAAQADIFDDAAPVPPEAAPRDTPGPAGAGGPAATVAPASSGAAETDAPSGAAETDAPSGAPETDAPSGATAPPAPPAGTAPPARSGAPDRSG